MADVERLLISPEDSIRRAMELIDATGRGIALVVDGERRLLGTVTDGDVRRAVLAGIDLAKPASTLIQRKAGTRYAHPSTAQAGLGPATLLKLMQSSHVRQLPLIDDDERVVDLVTLDDLIPAQSLPAQAVIMAGGFGTRLRPLTEDTPKPMLPIGDQPLMQHTLEQLRQAGIQRINVTTHFQPEKIVDYFGDGQAFGVELNYVNEDRPLGTAGALGLMPQTEETLLVINGDILTRVDFAAMLAFHRQHRAELTVGVRQYAVQIPYGVIECKGAQVRAVREKPSLDFLINGGIYLLEPCVRDLIPADQRFDMTDLIQALLAEGRTVVSFPIVEYWLDIGLPEDYVRAQDDIKSGRLTK